MSTLAYSLRRTRVSDAEAFVRLMSDEAVFAGLLQMPFPNVETWRVRLAENDAPGKADLSLVAEADGEIVGSGGLLAASPAVRRRHAMHLGLSVAAAWHRRGVGSALLAALLDYADRWAGALRIELTVWADNAPAIELYEKFGFVVEGRLRGYAVRGGRFVDALAMARWHPDPPRREDSTR